MASVMTLPNAGREYLHLQFTGLPAGANVLASLDATATWLPTDAGADDQERLLLLRGPGAAGVDGAPVTGRTVVWVRVDDSPEQVVRRAGEVQIV